VAALTAVASPRDDESLAPLPWRRMVWVTWRQHRAALTGVAAILVALSIFVGISGLHLHNTFSAAMACHPADSVSCAGLISSFNGTNGFFSNGLVLQAVPVLVGVFLGAPVLAREMETGTFRYAWTQGFERWRWTLAKLAALAVVVTVAAVALSVLFSWYYQPYFATGNQNLTEISPFAPGLFDLREVALSAWTLAAFAIGALAGMLIRRVVPAIVASLAAYVGLAIATGGFFREHYLAPVVTSRLDVFGPSWILGREWLKSGRPVSTVALGHVLQNGPVQLQGKGGVPQSPATWQYLVRHGYTQLTMYQPIGRFWLFQWMEGGWLLALSVLFIATTVCLVRRKVS
jgi:hypothetical protein